jgi:hypothetical protein
MSCSLRLSLPLLALILVPGCPVEPDPPADDDDDASQGPGNTSPTAPVVSLSPADPGVDEDLECVLEEEGVDPDGDEVTHIFSWLVDGEEAGVDTATLPASRTSAEEFWTCRAVASDGSLWSGVAEATVEVGHVNQPPSAPEVGITPGQPTLGDDLLCLVTDDSIDPEGLAVTETLAWTSDGADEGTDPEVDADDTAEGEVWTCTVTASDGELEATGEASVTIGPACNSVSLTGDGSIEIHDDPLLRLFETDFTIEAWVRRTGTDGSQHAIAYKRGQANEEGWGLFVAVESVSAGRITWIQSRGSDPALAATTTQLPGTWLHVAYTYDWDASSGDGEGTLFIDGEPSGTATLPSPSGTATAALSLGRDGGFDAHHLVGRLDDVHISSVVRYTGSFAPPPVAVADADTIALWRLEAGQGTLAVDSGTHGFDGTIVNGDWSELSACFEAR